MDDLQRRRNGLDVRKGNAGTDGTFTCPKSDVFRNVSPKRKHCSILNRTFSARPRRAVLSQHVPLFFRQSQLAEVLDLLFGSQDVVVRSKQESFHADATDLLSQRRRAFMRGGDV